MSFLELIEPKSKRLRLDPYSPVYMSPIQATHKLSVNAQVHKLSRKGKSTAVLGRPYFNGQFSSSRRHIVPLWRVLLDSGSNGDLLFQRTGSNTVPYRVRAIPQSWHTSGGIFHTKHQGDLEVTFPEYSQSKRMHITPDIVEFDSESPSPLFDLILGTDTMQRLGIILDFKTNLIEIDEIKLPMRDINKLQTPNSLMQIYKNSFYIPEEPYVTQEATKRTVKILDAKYEKADLPKVVHEQCAHLTKTEQEQLLQLLDKYKELFDGTLGKWKTSPVHLQLREGITPYHARRAYPIPYIHKDTLRKEVDRLEKLGVLKWEGDSEWASPTFIIPKPNGTVRFISDFREVNKRLRRKPWPIPKISTVLQELEGFRWATSLDLNMGYYTIRLDPDSQKICTIILPWGKYSYQRLPMGIAGSPDIFQERMSILMATLEFVRAYIDDLLLFSKDSFNDHLSKVEQVLVLLRDAGLRVNAPKSKFCVTETEYLGYVLTREGIRPQMKKVTAILALTPPKSVKSVRHFLGLVQYYRDIWEKRSDLCAPLTDLVGECGATKSKKKSHKAFHWDESHQVAFEAIKAIIARDVVLAYPDFSKVFEIYTDASSRQLGSVIVQNNRPIAFFSRKLSVAQSKYSITELELLSIVETLKEFRGMLWGQQIKVYTDHQNLMRDALGLTSNRVYRWRLLLEEYGPEITFIRGIHNTVADAISRLEYNPDVNPDHHCHMIHNISEESGIGTNYLQWKTVSKSLANCTTSCDTLEEETEINSRRPDEYVDQIRSAFANHSGEEEEIYPLTVTEIADSQKSDKVLRKLFKRGGENKQKDKVTRRYQVSLIEDTPILTDENLKMVIPKPLQERAVQWYHHYLQHPGHTRLEETLRATMTWSGMRAMVRRHTQNCQACQFNKRRKNQYGKLPTKRVISRP